jgi:hypothetical protein
MKKLLIRFIVWLFEKYAIDYWIDKKQEEAKQDFIKENSLEGCSEDEFIEAWIDKHKETNDAFEKFGLASIYY